MYTSSNTTKVYFSYNCSREVLPSGLQLSSIGSQGTQASYSLWLCQPLGPQLPTDRKSMEERMRIFIVQTCKSVYGTSIHIIGNNLIIWFHLSLGKIVQLCAQEEGHEGFQQITCRLTQWHNSISIFTIIVLSPILISIKIL